ncbi:MAG: glycosyltransferase family 39 protein [Chloroflexi bacterium]|nr:glycosyltransferase family 39 protein [Chloroflexota bacterium]
MAHADVACGWNRFDVAIAVVLAALAALPRTVNLLGLDPFIDEVAWVDWAVRQFEWSAPRSWLIPLLTDGRPPLFVWLTAPMAVLVDNGFLAGRLVSALAGTVSTVALYGLGRETASRRTGIAAALLWALSPFSFLFARIAADDALLTCLAILATWASIRLARRPTVGAGVWCGVLLALTVLAKTTGVLLAIAPPVALLLLGTPRCWRRYLRPLLAAFVAGLVTSGPLLLGLAPMIQQAALHTGGSKGSEAGLFAANLDLSLHWLDLILGWPFLALAGLGMLAALLLRRWALVAVLVVGVVLLGTILAITSPLFSRYLLFGMFPAYLLAGFAVERLAWLAGWTIDRFMPRLRPIDWVARLLPDLTMVVVMGVGVVLVLAPRAGLARDLVYDPARAALPDTEHFRYVEQWFAGYGLGQVVADLRARAASGPVVVLAAPASRENRVLLPHSALRFYLRRDPHIRVVDAPPIFRAQDLRELRRLTRDGQTFLVVNGSHTPAPGMPDEIPSYTRQLERRIEQDLPDAREVLRIARPTAPNWLSVYQLNP